MSFEIILRVGCLVILGFSESNIPEIPQKRKLVLGLWQLSMIVDTQLGALGIKMIGVLDLLTGWVQRKYGQDSIPYKLTSDARQSGLQKLARGGRVSVNSVSSQQSCSVGELNLARRGSVDSAGSLQSCSVMENEDVSGLFLLLPGSLVGCPVSLGPSA